MIADIFTLTIVFVAILLFMVYKLKSHNGPSLPGPKGLPVLGNVLDVKLDLLYPSLYAWTKQYGDIFQFNLFGRNMVSLNSSEMIRELFGNEPYASITAARPQMFAGKYITKYRDVFLPSFSDELNKRRNFVHKVMHTYGDGLKYLAGQITYLLSDLVDDIDRFKGKAFHPAQHIDRFVFGTLQILLIGKIPERREEFQRYLQEMDDSLNLTVNPGVDTLYTAFPFLRFTPLAGAKAYRLFKRKRAGFLDLLDSLTKGDDKNQGIYQQMLKVVKSKQNREWFNESIMLEVLAFNIVGAAYLTTRNSIVSLVRILLSVPHVQKRLQKEVDTVLGKDRKANINDRSNMPYTEAVILEVLRYISHVPLGGFHATSEDLNVRGCHIPKGTTIISNLWTAHHSDKEWKDPFTFNPDRFLNEDGNLLAADHPLRKQMLVFGFGKRSCIGEVFAKTRIFMFTATLMQSYTIEPEDGVVPPMLNNSDMKAGIVLQAPDYRCAFVRRT